MLAVRKMFLLSFISLGYFPSASMALEEVKLHTSGSGSPFPLIYNVSQDKGLDVLAISANLLTGIQGLAAGSFDFSQVLGQGSAAIFCAAFR